MLSLDSEYCKNITYLSVRKVEPPLRANAMPVAGLNGSHMIALHSDMWRRVVKSSIPAAGVREKCIAASSEAVQLSPIRMSCDGV